MTQQQEDQNPDPIGSVSKRDYLRLLLAALGVGAISTGSVETAKAAHLSDSPYPSGAWGYAPIASHGVSDRPSIAELNKAWSETYHFLNQDVDVGARYYAEKNDDVWDLLPIVWDGLDTPADSDVPAGGVMIEQQESASAFRLLGIDDDASHFREATVDWVELPFDQLTTLTFDTTAEHDGNIAEKGVHHEQPTGTDWAAPDIVEKGYATFDQNGSDLAAYYPMDEDSGTTANDVSGNANDGSIAGITLGATGILGTTAYNFDGTDDWFEVTGATDLDTNNAFTIAGWLNFTDPDAPSNTMVGIEEGGSWSHVRFKVRKDPDRLIAGIGNGFSKIQLLEGGTDLNTNTWYHAVVTYVSDSSYVLYLNGSSDASTTPEEMPNIGTTWDIGRDDRDQQYFSGRLSDWRFYTRALSATEVQELYEAAL